MAISTLRLRHLAAAGLFAAAATVSGSAIGETATACAEPREWDVADYDSCIHAARVRYEQSKQTAADGQRYLDDLRFCCDRSGGVWGQTSLGEGCVAPPANNSAHQPGNGPIHTFQPEPPPARQVGSVNPIVTFAPAN